MLHQIENINIEIEVRKKTKREILSCKVQNQNKIFSRGAEQKIQLAV